MIFQSVPSAFSWFCGFAARHSAPAIITIAAALYAVCACGNLWLDEILSLQWARNARSWTDLLVLFRHDNNHPLNSLWLYAVGMGQHPLLYRAVSIAAGVGSLVLLDRIAARLIPRARLFVLAMAATSYALAVYFSEARGYAAVVFCALLCFWILLVRGDRPGIVAPVAFWAASLAGILAHATFIYPLGGMGVWVAASGFGNDRRPWPALARAALWFGIPFALFVGYYFFYLRQMLIAGGPDLDPLQIAAEFFGYGLGLPVGRPFSYLTVVVSVLGLGAAVLFGKFSGERLRVFFVSTLVVLPGIGLAATRPEYLHFRYFLVLLPFMLLALGGLIEQALAADSRRAWLFLFLLAVCVAFQWPRFAALLTLGRGGYPEILARLSGAGGPATFSATHDMMGGLVMEHYRRRIVPTPPVHFVPAARVGERIPEWFLVVDQSDPPAAAPGEFAVFERTYEFDSAAYAAPVSGAHWFLYRLKSQTTTN